MKHVTNISTNRAVSICDCVRLALSANEAVLSVHYPETAKASSLNFFKNVKAAKAGKSMPRWRKNLQILGSAQDKHADFSLLWPSSDWRAAVYKPISRASNMRQLLRR